ncbi:hypothetical protein ACIF6I_36380 [Streptomyces microflavus]|uniref:Uncharacterized protein n=1 Tax=Streptomyces microflavus DSM 40593 TaxID=1303692 RepID=N0CHF6_STRMI|nr:hypothetical protein [Streptomyces microflavus]AGK75115.1 hypothetical protein SFUL_130 [Streptomyces microflavus DSM 40593]
MDRYAEFIIVPVIGSLQLQADERGVSGLALQSMRELVANDEPEIAIDYLVNTVNSFGLTLKRDEYERLSALAVRLQYADILTDIRPELILS